MAKSVEEEVVEYFKALLDNLGIRHFGKTEEVKYTRLKSCASGC